MGVAPDSSDITSHAASQIADDKAGDAEVIEVQRSRELSCRCPSDELLVKWARAGLEGVDTGLTIRIVDPVESRASNRQWRDKDSATNVLSFPADLPPEVGVNYAGDLVVCADVVAQESEVQQKSLNDHWAHIVIHGVLHLRGFDHENKQDAEVMEKHEKEILATLGVADPYRDDPDSSVMP